VAYINGDIDPWHKQGVLPDTKLPAGSVAILTPNASHCADMSVRINEPKQLLATRARINATIGGWLRQLATKQEPQL